MLRAEGWLPNDLFSLRKDEKDIWNIKNTTKNHMNHQQ
jgi:hypothetical protein